VPDKIDKAKLLDTAYSNTNVYSSKDFPAYNPDDLVGIKGIGIYSKMMNDEQIKVVMRFRREATTGRDFIFEIEEDIPEEDKEHRIRLFENIVSRIKGSFKQKLDCIQGTSMTYGFSITEKVLELMEFEGKQWYGIKNLKKKPISSFNFYVDDYGNLEKFKQLTTDNEITLDMDNFIHHVYNADYDEYYGRSELREVYRAYFSKDILLKFRNIHLERFGSGFIYAQPEEETELVAGSSEWDALVDLLNRLQTASSAILPKGIKLDVIQPQNTDGFEKAIAMEDAAIVKGLLMPNLMGFSEIKAGNRSLGESQSKVFFKILNAEAKMLAEVLNEQLFKELGELNFPDGIYPKFKFVPLSDEEKDYMITKWIDLVKAKAVTVTSADEDRLRELLDMPEKAEDDENNIDVNGGDSTDPDDENNKDNNDGNGNTDDSSNEETVIGDKLLQSAMFARNKAMKRVNFAVIDKKSNDSIEESSNRLSNIFATGLEDIVLEIRVEKLGTQEGNIEKSSKLKFNSRVLSRMRATLDSTLKKAWRLGSSEAKLEITKAKKETVSVDFARLETEALSYFKNKSFSMAGKLSEDALAIIKNILANGLKYGKTTDTIVKEIYTSFAKKGMLSMEDVEQALGAALDIPNPTARLKTTIRTNYFDALNEARFNYFNDPALQDFVQAFTYSSILDERSTSICQELDGRTFSKDSDEWSTYRPPNHMNCRSVLIPVTEADEWSSSSSPSIMPNEGFS